MVSGSITSVAGSTVAPTRRSSINGSMSFPDQAEIGREWRVANNTPSIGYSPTASSVPPPP